MKIGLIGAMYCEISGIIARMDGAREVALGQYLVTEGKIGGCDVACVCSGIGLVNGALAAQLLIDRFGVDCVINPGVAGALSKELNVCDFVISTDAVHWDLSLSVPGVLDRNFPFCPEDAFPADAFLTRRALDVCRRVAERQNVLLGRVASGQVFVDDLATKERIAETFGAKCVEMEGAGIAHACFIAKKPYMIIRSISDCLADNGEDSKLSFDTFLEIACKQLSEVMVELIRSIHPEEWRAGQSS